MLPLKGRISFHQFSSSKRIQFGIKAWVLADSKSGYVYGFSCTLVELLKFKKICLAQMLAVLLRIY